MKSYMSYAVSRWLMRTGSLQLKCGFYYRTQVPSVSMTCISSYWSHGCLPLTWHELALYMVHTGSYAWYYHPFSLHMSYIVVIFHYCLRNTNLSICSTGYLKTFVTSEIFLFSNVELDYVCQLSCSNSRRSNWIGSWSCKNTILLFVRFWATSRWKRK